MVSLAKVFVAAFLPVAICDTGTCDASAPETCESPADARDAVKGNSLIQGFQTKARVADLDEAKELDKLHGNEELRKSSNEGSEELSESSHEVNKESSEQLIEDQQGISALESNLSQESYEKWHRRKKQKVKGRNKGKGKKKKKKQR